MKVVNFTYERDIVSSYMVFHLSANEIEAYALKMLQYNQIPNLLQVSEKSGEHDHHLCYEITDKISLFEYTKSNALGYVMLKKLIESILELSSTFQEYLLSEGCFFLDTQTLFFDLQAEKCYFLYLPVVTQPFDFLEQLKAIVSELFKNIHRHDERAISLIHKLRMVLEEENFGIVSIKKLLELEEKIHLQPVHTEQEPLYDVPNLAVKKMVKRGSKDAWITFLVFQVILGVVVSLYCVGWVLPEDNGLAVLLKIIMLLSGLCLCEFALVSKLKALPRKQERDDYEERAVESRTEGAFMDEISSEVQDTPLVRETLQVEETQQVQDKFDFSATPVHTLRPPSKWGWDNHKTERLSRAQQRGAKRAYWVDAVGVKTPIIKTPLLIGKFIGAVDISIDDDGVGKIHCKIVQESDAYYLIQMDSHNKTYLNYQQLKHNERNLLQDGDGICIADETFTFQCI